MGDTLHAGWLQGVTLALLGCARAAFVLARRERGEEAIVAALERAAAPDARRAVLAAMALGSDGAVARLTRAGLRVRTPEAPPLDARGGYRERPRAGVDGSIRAALAAARSRAGRRVALDVAVSLTAAVALVALGAAAVAVRGAAAAGAALATVGAGTLALAAWRGLAIRAALARAEALLPAWALPTEAPRAVIASPHLVLARPRSLLGHVGRALFVSPCLLVTLGLAAIELTGPPMTAEVLPGGVILQMVALAASALFLAIAYGRTVVVVDAVRAEVVRSFEVVVRLRRTVASFGRVSRVRVDAVTTPGARGGRRTEHVVTLVDERGDVEVTRSADAAEAHAWARAVEGHLGLASG